MHGVLLYDVRGIVLNLNPSHILTHFAHLQLMTVEKKSKKIQQFDIIKLRNND